MDGEVLRAIEILRDVVAPELEVGPTLADAAKRCDASGIRVFWKGAADWHYLGGNDCFARDAGLADASGLPGKSDFSDEVAWARQASKYRADDEAVFASKVPFIDVLERQDTPEGTQWLRTAKTRIRGPEGPVGIVGMYRVLTDQQALALRDKLGRPVG